MNISIVISNVSGGGLGCYNKLLYKTLLSLGHDVKFYYFSDNSQFNNFSNYDNVEFIKGEFTDKYYNEINKSDYIFVGSICIKQEDEDYQNKYFDMLMNKFTAKKIFFIHNRQYRGFISAYPKFAISKEFITSFHKIVTFDKNDEVWVKFTALFGEEALKDKFVHLELLYNFDENKRLWKDVSDKDRRVSYFGRCVKIKDPERLLEMSPKLFENNWMTEMRGITRSIGVVSFKNLIYHWDPVTNKQTTEKSKITEFFDKTYKEKHNIDKHCKYLTKYAHTNKTCLIFPEYNIDEGMEALSYQCYGCNFFNLKGHPYGDTVEFTIYDIVNAGVIPLLDYDMGQHVHVYKNGVRTDKTIFDLNAGIFVKDDLSNLDEVIEKLNFLYDNPEEYNKFRNNCLEIYKEHSNPENAIKNLLNNI